MDGRLRARSSGFRAEVGDSRGVAVHHSRSGAELWELGAGLIAGDIRQHLDDFALGNASVIGFGDGASSYTFA